MAVVNHKNWEEAAIHANKHVNKSYLNVHCVHTYMYTKVQNLTNKVWWCELWLTNSLQVHEVKHLCVHIIMHQINRLMLRKHEICVYCYETILQDSLKNYTNLKFSNSWLQVCIVKRLFLLLKIPLLPSLA